MQSKPLFRRMPVILSAFCFVSLFIACSDGGGDGGGGDDTLSYTGAETPAAIARANAIRPIDDPCVNLELECIFAVT